MDNRAVSPVVEKVLAAGIVVLYVSATTTLFLGGIVPDYRGATGQEVAERTHASVLAEVEDVLPATSGEATVRARLDLPTTIAGANYDLVVGDGHLELDHPDERIGVRSALWVPENVTVIDARVRSGADPVVSLSGEPGNRTLTVTEGSR